MVGVARDLAPSVGSGAELYTVIGHAPRALDRNIAVVGRVVDGIEWLSSLPRGTGDLGFYATPAERSPIVSARLASDLPAPLGPRWLARVARSSAPFPSDAPPDALERLRALPQFASVAAAPLDPAP